MPFTYFIDNEKKTFPVSWTQLYQDTKKKKLDPPWSYNVLSVLKLSHQKVLQYIFLDFKEDNPLCFCFLFPIEKFSFFSFGKQL